jgi:hypothetical protein
VEINRHSAHCFIRYRCRSIDMLKFESKRSAHRLGSTDSLCHRADGCPKIVLCDSEREKRAADILIVDAGEEFPIRREPAVQRIPSVWTKVRAGDESYEQHKP